MLNRITKLVLWICVFGIFSCGSAIVKEEDVQALNQEFANKVFTSKKDIFANFSDPNSRNREILFRKGEKLRIWVESEDDWVKVRAIRDGQNIENTQGQPVIYIIRDILEDQDEPESIVESYPVDRLKKEIFEILR